MPEIHICLVWKTKMIMTEITKLTPDGYTVFSAEPLCNGLSFITSRKSMKQQEILRSLVSGCVLISGRVG